MQFKVSPVQGRGGRQTLAYESAGELKDPSPSHLSTHTTSHHSHQGSAQFFTMAPSPQAATSTTSTHLSSYFPSAEVHQEDDDSGFESDQLSHRSVSSTSGSPSHSTLELHHQ